MKFDKEHERLACAMARKYCRETLGFSIDDARQLARIGVWKAWRSFKPEKGKFANWAWYWMRREVRRGYAANKRQLRAVREDLPPAPASQETVAIQKQVIAGLTPDEKELFSSDSYADAARKRGVSRERIRQVADEVLRKVRYICDI